MPFTNDRIRCVDRRDVYFDMMRMVLTDQDNKWVRDEDTGTYWTEEMVAAASRELLRDCIGRKAANAFFLGLGPFMCTVSVLTCLFTMFKYCTPKLPKRYVVKSFVGLTAQHDQIGSEDRPFTDLCQAQYSPCCRTAFRDTLSADLQ